MIPKFRAWDKRQNVMRDVAVLHFTKSGKVNSIEYWKTHYELKPYHVRNIELMQSTGLKDKNGVEIFEGDVVFRKDGECSFKGIVKKDRFYFYIEGTNIRDSFSFEDVADVQTGEADLEVIGNIYENPELMKEVRK